MLRSMEDFIFEQDVTSSGKHSPPAVTSCTAVCHRDKHTNSFIVANICKMQLFHCFASVKVVLGLDSERKRKITFLNIGSKSFLMSVKGFGAIAA